MNRKPVRFSLLLCTVGRRDDIAVFLESLIRQNRDDYEVILVDQNGDGRLDDIVSRYAGRLPLLHVKTPVRGKSRALNLGLTRVNGSIVGFPDDDCEYFDGYLDALAAAFDADAGLGGLTGYPTNAATRTLPADWRAGAMEVDRVTVFNRCQEFTIFVRRQAIGALRYNDGLGVGAGTPWGAEEGPDFLVRVIEGGAKIVFYPRLFVYHPDKISTVTPAVVERAVSYARGRGAYFRLHRYPVPLVAKTLIRTAGGVVVYGLRLQPSRARYYLAVLGGLLRGLLMSPGELKRLRRTALAAGDPVAGTEESFDRRPLATDEVRLHA